MGRQLRYIDTSYGFREYIITELPNNSGWMFAIYDNELDIAIHPPEIYSNFERAKSEMIKASKGNYKQVSLVEV